MPRIVDRCCRTVSAVEAIAPMIVAHRDEAETDGDLSLPVVEALKDAELVNLFLPRSLGGLEGRSGIVPRRSCRR